METSTLRYYAMLKMLANYPEIASQIQQDMDSALDQIENRILELTKDIDNPDDKNYIQSFILEELDNNWFHDGYFFQPANAQWTPKAFIDDILRTLKLLDLSMNTQTIVNHTIDGNFNKIQITGTTVTSLVIQLQHFLDAYKAQEVGNFYIFQSMIIGYTVTDKTNMTITVQ